MDDPVHEQYEAYPYPRRDPHDEAKRLITGSPSNLPEVNHYLFAGRRDLSRPFRALVAGGGTGDAAIMLAQQLSNAGTGGTVVYLDISASARAITEARAEVRELGNITFLTGSLIELPDLDLGLFDYIDCCGVLHHLEDPAAGLAALTAVLAEDGGLGLMVYGEYGRTGLYPLQDLIRRLGATKDLDARIALTRRVIDALPPTNWFRRNPFLGDYRRGDAELVDLCLHSRDRAYTVPQLAALLESAGLEIVTFIEPYRYDPATYLDDPVLLERLAPLSALDRAAVAEALIGNIKKHIVYAARRSPDKPATQGRIAGPDGPAAVPILQGLDATALASTLRREAVLIVRIDDFTRRYPLPPLSADIAAQIDGRRTLREIHANLQARVGSLDWLGFKNQFDQFYAVLSSLNSLLITYPSTSVK